MSQKSRLLRKLNLDGSVCAMETLDWTPRIYRVGARILELREEGYEIVTHNPCHRHREPEHHAMYELARIDGGTLF